GYGILPYPRTPPRTPHTPLTRPSRTPHAPFSPTPSAYFTIRIGRRRHPHRSTQTSASVDADAPTYHIAMYFSP
ncbi:hypothetical protein, partial [Leyella stercorea]|uniref:hypothetical protein n=1 Tax=Leyella stercorea TaxID=363265 RepID=UPI001C0FF3E2